MAGKVYISTLENQMDRGLIEDTRVEVTGERSVCSGMVYLGTRYRIAGSKKRYTRSKPRKQYPCTLPATRMIAGKPYCAHHGPGKYHADPYYDTKAWRQLRQQTLERDGNVCQYCGNMAHQADHVHPRVNGGVDDLSNLVACCARCNRVARNAEFSSFTAKRSWIRQQITGKTEKLNHQRPRADLETVSIDET